MAQRLAPLGLAEVPTGRPQTLTSPGQVPEGLAKSDWHSIRAAYEVGRHAFMPIEGGWQARNPGQQWTTVFDRRGFLSRPREGAWTWGLELKSYGFGEAHRTIDGVPTVKADGQRLSYGWDATVTEWFVNDPRGLEHGFTVKERPAGAASGPLQFDLAVRGTLLPQVTADGSGVRFGDAAGGHVLDYSGLKVWDADGKTLSSRFVAVAAGVRLLVDEAGARYPLTIDPIAQQAYLKSGNNGAATDDQFGWSVAVSGDTVVIGAPREDSSTMGVNSTPNENATEAGAAYVFVRSGAMWTQQAYLKAGNSGAGDLFGYSVAVSGDTVVVGANFEDSSTSGVNSTSDESASNAGAAYVFVRSGSTWTQQAYFKASNPGSSDEFGRMVAVSGDTVVVGAVFEDSSTSGINSTPNESAANAGAAYVFVRNGSTWAQQAYLKASNPGAGDQFGISVAVSGDTVVVGSYGEDSSTAGVNGTPNESGFNAGAAYVFVRSGSTWAQQAYLKASNPGAGDQFGTAVGISGNTVVVGANFEDSSTAGVNSTPNDNASNAGAAYVFVRSGSTWTQQAYLKASNPGFDDQFGWSVAVSGDTVAVGAYFEDASTSGVNDTPNDNASNAGAAYVFVRSGSTWTQQAYFKASNPAANDQFGASVAASGDTVIVGATGEDSSASGVNSAPNENADGAGAAYVFVRSGSTWTQQAYLKASNPGADDQFGRSVAVSGDTVVVGALGEDSSTAGVNSTPNESASEAGAAYVFVRSGSTWAQQAYLKAGNPGALDQFGRSVAVSGDTVVVGAFGEDSSTAGVNSTPNESTVNAGAAYVFVRNGSTWTQQAYLKASNPGGGDSFGYSVAVADNTVVVGAILEDSGTAGVNSMPSESASDAGAAYVFVRSGSTWTQQAYLKAGNAGAGDEFGRSVAVTGDTVVVGAEAEDSSTAGVNSTPNEGASSAGAAYVFVRNGSTWTQQAYLKAGNPGASDQFGTTVAVSGDTVIVGAIGEDSSTAGVNSTPNENAVNAGAAYVFVRNGSTWPQQAYLKAGNPGASDQFGVSVAVAGDTLVVGAIGEDSSTAGVNSTPNEGANEAGAAYVFVRSGSTWTQQAYLKARNPGAADQFGRSVAMSGDTAVVGATGEDSSTSGVDSTPDESAGDAGAAYVFVVPVNIAPTDITLSNATLAENNPPGVTIGTLTATDPDAGDQHTFSLVAGAGSTDNAAFTLTGNMLTLNGSADFETQSTYHLRIRATDNGTPPTNFEKEFVLAITDVPENVPPVVGPDALNRPNTTTVGKVLKSALLGNDSDADLDPLTLTAVGNALPAGSTVILAGNFVIYTAPTATAGNGSFEYTLSDGPGGHTVTGTVTVTETSTTGGASGTPNALAITPSGNDFIITFIGVPGGGYRVQYTTSTAEPYAWTEFSPPATHTAADNGVFTHTDLSPPNPTRLYRAVGNP